MIRTSRKPPASALVVILVAIVMVAVLVIAFLAFARTERGSSRMALDLTVGRSLANLAADAALGKLKYGTETGMQAGKLWASEPGRIRVFKAADLADFEDVNLFSALPGPDDPAGADVNSVDLNQPSYEGKYPIATGSAAAMKIGWINLRGNLNEPASKDNPITGRIAYWVDDESCKINLNVADGSKKDTVQSFGFGTPSEINLAALKDGAGTRLTEAVAAKVSAYAWQQGFNTPAEISRASDAGDIPADFFEQNKFQITHYSKAPEISFNGDPRIYLFPVARMSANGVGTYGLVRSLLTNAYGVALTGALGNYLIDGGDAAKARISDPVDFVYPTSRQITAAVSGTFYQYGRYSDLDRNQFVSSSPNGTNYENYLFAKRIAESIKGRNSLSGAFQWPAFSGSNGFAGKYNDRQIDSLALQIMDLGSRSPMGDEARMSNLPSLITTGLLSGTSGQGQNAFGMGRTPKFTEFTFSFDAIRGKTLPNPGTNNVPMLQVDPRFEFFFPSTYEGVTWSNQLSSYWRVGNGTRNDANTSTDIFMINQADHYYSTGAILGGWWYDNLLSITGINMGGLSYNSLSDPDPRSSIYHAYRMGRGPSSNSQPSGNRRTPFAIAGVVAASLPEWKQGEYRLMVSSNSAVALYGPNDPTLTQFDINGGIALWTQAGGAGGRRGHWDVAPLDSLRGDYRDANPSMQYYDSNYIYTNETPLSIKADLKQAVIPLPPGFTIPVPSVEHVWHGYVTDPLVNKFPADWIISGSDNDVSLPMAGTAARNYTDGANPGFNASQGGDPLSLWMPRLDVAYPKQSRFPSVGALNYVRTGVMPDDLSIPLPQQRGTPWRSLSFTPSASAGQATAKGSYPDWAMLDLFTVPFLPQLPFRVGAAATPKRKLTSGGATEGKLNINNPAVPFPFSQTLSAGEQANFPQRTAPLEALFYKLRINTGYATDEPIFSTLNDAYVDTNGNKVLDKLVNAIQTRVKTNGPFVLPGQIAELSDIDQFTYKGVPAGAQSRNDLVKQVIGATTTQSNVFSIWVVAQTVRKRPTNQAFGAFEANDTVTSEVRRRYVVERYIDPGTDGVPGNAINPGADKVVGTEDDPIDANYHPAMKPPFPYLWRIVSVEDIAR